MYKKSAKIISAIIGPAVLMAAPYAAFAQTGAVVPATLTPINNLLNILRAGIQFILVIAFVLAFIFLLIGGLRWITAGGDEKAIGSARNMITAALIGLVIILVAYAIIRLVEIFFGVNIVTGGITLPNAVNPPF